MKETAHNVAQTSTASKLIARDIQQVNSGSQQIFSESKQLTEKAHSLDAISQELKKLVQGFVFSKESGDIPPV